MKKMGKVSSNKVLPSGGSAVSSSSSIKTAAKPVEKKAPTAGGKTSKVSPAPAATAKGKTGTTAPSKGAKGKVAPSGGAKPATKAAAAPPEPVVDPNKGINGEVTICYNHYKKKFPIVDASTTQAAVDEEYYLTFAFPNSKLHLSVYSPSDFSFEDNGMCVWHVCVACVCGMCVWHVCVACVCGICVWHVCVACVCGMCVWHVCVACVCGICVWHVCVACVCGMCV